ncbi:TadE/TadG family type IV pilus assembly protein [Anderseniella sp. Alg231-50]|uniref:TadE/TadG family type IV pilus assembly protein n=1 Tax=Anderseniella sp. Alg231-50 TaxID=1922226 RepID=UPI00307BB180
MTYGSNRIKTAIRQQADGFSRDTQGAVALIAGLVAVPMILAAGAAIDFYRVDAARAAVQASLDAGALAGAAAKPGTSDTVRSKIAIDTFEANLQGGFADKLKGAPEVSFDNDNLTVTYNGGLPSTLLRVGGFNEFNVGASSSVRINLPSRAEIALVLDYSSSMESYSAGQQKYVTMRKAAIDMVNGLTDNGNNAEVEFGLVPFSHNVYTTLPASHVVGAGGGNWTGCTYDRQYPYNTTSATPGGSDKSKWGQATPAKFGSYKGQANYHCDGYKHNGNGYQANQLQVRELSSNHSDIVGQLQAMEPYGYTNISLGVEFGWHLLEPGAPFAARSHTDEENKKFIVVLTDGKQTTPAFGPGNSRDRFDGEDNLTKLCSNIKSADQITVITIAFALKDNATETRLRNCSTDPDKHFFKAESSNDLTRAFEEIQQQIAKAIFLSK